MNATILPAPTKRRAAWVYLLFALVLTPQIIVLIKFIEVWPFTSAPMFASPARSVYRFEWLLQRPKGKAVEIKPSLIPLRGPSTLRHFFQHVYRSASTRTPYFSFAPDSPNLFTERLGNYFGSLADYISQLHPHWIPPGSKIQLSVVEMNNLEKPTNRHTVGRYSISDRVFTHTSGKP